MTKNSKRFVDYLGWYGVAAILVAYTFLSLRFLTIDQPLYQLLNITGSLGIAIEARYKKDLQPMILNSIWMVVACLALLQMIFR
jgi:hypothetical protein